MLEDEESDISDMEDSATRASFSRTPRRSSIMMDGSSLRTDRSSTDNRCTLPIVSTAKKTKARPSAVFADDSSDAEESEDLVFAFRK